MNPPNDFSTTAKRWWRKLNESYEFSEDTYLLLTVMFEAYDEFQTARISIKRDGAFIKGKNGAVKKNPYLELLKISRSQFLSCWRLLGFNISEMPSEIRK